MATLEHLATGRPFCCAATTVVGRDPRADLLLDDNGVSGEHAQLSFNGLVWHLKDMGSRNGTWVGDRRVTIGYEHALQAGEVLRFGVTEQRWLVLDVDPPDDDAPADVLEPLEAIEPIIGFTDIDIHIRVGGSDDAPVEIDLVTRDDRLRLAARPFHALVLVLAQARIADRDKKPDEAGWMYTDTLARQLGCTRPEVDRDAWLARKQLHRTGVRHAVRLFERRARTGQIRLGTAHVRLDGL